MFYYYTMKILSIDPGKTRIGLAVFDDTVPVVVPREPLTISSMEDALDQLVRLVEEESFDKMLMGYPLNMDGSPNLMCQWVDSLTEALQKRVSLPIIKVDERLTTHEALKRIGGGKKRRARVDSIAAVLILESYLSA